MEKVNFKVGETVVIDERYIGVHLYHTTEQSGILNVFDMETKQSSEVATGKHVGRIATKEERRMYWDYQVGTTPEKHCDDEDIIPAGSVVVFGEQYIAIIGTDIPKEGNFRFLTFVTADFKTFERCNMPKDIELPQRLATLEEALQFYKKLLNY